MGYVNRMAKIQLTQEPGTKEKGVVRYKNGNAAWGQTIKDLK